MSRLKLRAEHSRRGSALIEFTLVGSFIFLPMLAGLATVGLNMSAALQIANLNANAGQMFSNGTDFTQASNVAILKSIAGTLNTAPNSGGVIVLSEIDGTANGWVCSNQVTVTIGTGPSTPFTSQFYNNGAVTANFTMSPIVTGQSSFVAESYFNSPFPWLLASSSTGIYVKAIY